MIEFLSNKNKTDKQKPSMAQQTAQPRPLPKTQIQNTVIEDTAHTTDTVGFYDFQRQVYTVKSEVIKAIEDMSKQDAIDKLIILSNLSAMAIYSQNLREIVVVDDAITEIKRTIDNKLASLKDSDNEKISAEAEYYTLIRLSMIPVCSMLNVIDTHTSMAITQANEEIDGKIQELQRFLVEYETQLVSKKRR